MTIVMADRWFAHPNGKFRRQGFFLDPVLKHNLDNFLIKGVKNGHDGIVLITGLEGTGKSSFTQALAAYCDAYQSLDINRVVFSGRDLMTAIDFAKPETALIFDEAIMDMSSQDFATEMQKILIKKFTLIRKKRLFIFIVIPSLFMLRKYFAIFRTRAMINCICPDGMTRGFFRFYSFSTKKKLYLKGMKDMDMGCVKPDFSGRFIDSYGFFIDADAYEAKKDEAIKKLTEEKEDSDIMKLKNSFEDYKMKLKLDVDKFKESWKTKFGEQKNKVKEIQKTMKDQYDKKYNDIKTQAIDLQKSNDKKKISELERQYATLIWFVFDMMKREYELRNPGSKFSDNAFKNVLTDNVIINFTYPKLQKYLEDGENYVKLDTTIANLNK